MKILLNFLILFFFFFIMSELGSMLRLLGPKLCRIMYLTLDQTLPTNPEPGGESIAVTVQVMANTTVHHHWQLLGWD